MKATYDKETDVLYIRFDKEPNAVGWRKGILQDEENIIYLDYAVKEPQNLDYLAGLEIRNVSNIENIDEVIQALAARKQNSASDS